MAFKRGMGWTLLALGVLFLLLTGMGLMGDRDKAGSVLAVFGLPGIVMSLAGGLWLRRIGGREREEYLHYQEKAVLDVAADNGGFATIAAITLHTPLSADDAEAAISRLCQRNVAQPELMDDGTVAYSFGGLARRSGP
jgi:hypothetical protein